MIGQMAIAIALLGFNDLGCSVTPTCFSETDFIYNIIIPTLSKNEQKINVGRQKKIHDFCPRDIESCHHAAARPVKLWSLNVNLFFDRGTSSVD